MFWKILFSYFTQKFVVVNHSKIILHLIMFKKLEKKGLWTCYASFVPSVLFFSSAYRWQYFFFAFDEWFEA